MFSKKESWGTIARSPAEGPKPITCLRGGAAWGDRMLWPGDDRFGMRSLGCC
ncbi:MAG: hypothetical protein WBL95_00400 [Microcoleus sp.]